MNIETASWANSFMTQVSQFVEAVLAVFISSAPILIPLLVFVVLVILYFFSSVKILNQGNQGIVERLGRYHRTLKPGLNFVIPIVDNVLVETTREQILDIEPILAITKDNVTLSVDAVMYWRILDVARAYYAIENLETALKNLVITSLRTEIGDMELRQVVSSRNKINQALLRMLDEATEAWGIKVTRVEVQEVRLSDALRDALELERAAESRRKAAISEVEGVVEANIRRTESTIKSMRFLSEAMQSQPYANEVLQFLLAQDYIQANYRLAESANSKVVFMDPKLMSQIFESLSNSPNFDIDIDPDE